jgi:hypothetical protein
MDSYRQDRKSGELKRTVDQSMLRARPLITPWLVARLDALIMASTAPNV